jgi:lysophospholipase L1-like esterase
MSFAHLSAWLRAMCLCTGVVVFSCALACSSKSSSSGQGGSSGSTSADGSAGEGATSDATAQGGSTDGSADVAMGGGPVLDGSWKLTHTGPVRIMAVGDSITRSTCWRGLLWQELNQNDMGRFDFVGTLSDDPGCAIPAYDKDHQGYGSSLLTEVVAGITNARKCDPSCPSLNDFKTAFGTAMPDVLLVHYGTNDVWNAKPTASITSAYTALIAAAREVNPNIVVLLAQIIPMNVTETTCGGCSCPGCPTAIPALNAQIATLATSMFTADSPVIAVDQYAGFDATQDTKDGVHPNPQGAQKMADRWYAALTQNHLIP